MPQLPLLLMGCTKEEENRMIAIVFLAGIIIYLILCIQDSRLLHFRFLLGLFITIALLGLAFMPLTGFQTSISIFAMSLGCLGVVFLLNGFGLLVKKER